MSLSIIILVFLVIFIAELPDKSMLASITLSTRYRKLYVWAGAATAFLVHVVIAVTAGHFLTLLPKRAIEVVVAILFAIGAYIVLSGKTKSDKDIVDLAAREAKRLSHSFIKVFTTSFLIIFLGEWGDITQILTANYAAKYHNSLSVGIGAVLGLWAVAAFGIIAGSKVLERIPARTVYRFIGALLLLFALLSIIAAVK